MRVTARRLSEIFLSICRRMVTTTANVSVDVDNRRLQVQKSYVGVGSEPEIRRQAVLNDTDFYALHPGEVYFSNEDVCTFLNAAWEQLHREKCKALQDILMNNETSSTQMESLLYEHDELYRTTQPLEEFLAREKGGWTSIYHLDLTAFSSRIFVLPRSMIENGPPVIVNCTLHEYKGVTIGAAAPDMSRVCRPVSPHEITGLINLATNSRYTSGSLFRHRKFPMPDNKIADVIEVFHQDETAKKGGFFTRGAGTFIALGYIKYPKSITLSEVTAPPGDINLTRWIECAYPHEIATAAAMGAMGAIKHQ